MVAENRDKSGSRKIIQERKDLWLPIVTATLRQVREESNTLSYVLQEAFRSGRLRVQTEAFATFCCNVSALRLFAGGGTVGSGWGFV
jgi:hypothetical protein